jgi:hypothetical protein
MNVGKAIDQLFKMHSDNYVFVYTPPKVGSTTLVTSLRVSLNKNYNIIHIHDEVMLSVLTGINGVTINDILTFLSSKGKQVYVIDVYRTPVERKMSEFFEKISPYHFNNTEENISQHYTMERIANRFNCLFPYLEQGDHYFQRYGIPEHDIVAFDFTKKFSLQTWNHVTYIKLRLCDSTRWSSILSSIFRADIVIISDYKTEDKGVGALYKRFKEYYRLPINFHSMIAEDKYLRFYYNEEERKRYLTLWQARVASTNPFTPFTESEYAFYMRLCLENQFINDIQEEHYIDNGCCCVYCTKKRKELFVRAKNGEKHFEKIVHREVVNEVRNEKINLVTTKIKQFIQKRKTDKFTKNQFAIHAPR